MAREESGSNGTGERERERERERRRETKGSKDYIVGLYRRIDV
jgi:hypothetical protein